jgi:hypothetical protein
VAGGRRRAGGGPGGGSVTLVIGTDEAGYGPNLGPLVVAASAWRVAADPAAAEAIMAAAVAAAAPKLWGDSKQIYRGGTGWEPLERGVHVALALAGHGPPAGWPDLALALAAMAGEPPERQPLERLALPRERHEPACEAVAPPIAAALAVAGVRLVDVRCRIVQPGEFNALLDAGLNKSDILSQVTLELAAGLAAGLAAAAAEPVVVWCDRHGGRRRYAPQVARAFGLSLVQPLGETPAWSGYVLPGGGRIEFAVGGEARAPVALASMTAKYVRELAMLAFNEHWSGRQPGLAATAGYPVDAARWRREAAAAVEAAGLSWNAIWRRA